MPEGLSRFSGTTATYPKRGEREREGERKPQQRERARFPEREKKSGTYSPRLALSLTNARFDSGRKSSVTRHWCRKRVLTAKTWCRQPSLINQGTSSQNVQTNKVVLASKVRQGGQRCSTLSDDKCNRYLHKFQTKWEMGSTTNTILILFAAYYQFNESVNSAIGNLFCNMYGTKHQRMVLPNRVVLLVASVFVF